MSRAAHHRIEGPAMRKQNEIIQTYETFLNKKESFKTAKKILE
jgi:hypothetical protein